MGTLYMLKMTFSGKHQLLRQHLEVDQGGTPHDQTPTLDPTIASNHIIQIDINKMVTDSSSIKPENKCAISLFHVLYISRECN